MTVNQLKYALTLRKFSSFRLAAEKLGITQPGLSLQIQKLEEALGFSLFDRTSLPISATAEGSTFLDKAEEIVAGFDQLVDFSTTMGEGFDGTLTLGIIPTLAPYLVPLFVEDLQTNHPGFKLDIHEMTTEQVVRGVRDGSLDAGIISTPAELPGIKMQTLLYERFFLYKSKDEPVGTELELRNIDYRKLWLLNEGNCFKDQVNNFCDLNKIRKDKDFIYRSNSIDALIRIVDTKGGMTILPELSTLSITALQEEQLRAIGFKAREISLIVRKASNKERFILKLEQHIKKNVPSGMLSANGLEVVDPGIKM